VGVIRGLEDRSVGVARQGEADGWRVRGGGSETGGGGGWRRGGGDRCVGQGAGGGSEGGCGWL